MANRPGFDSLKKGYGFTSLDTATYPRLIVAAQARWKRGKSHFALTAPKPMVFYNIDDGLEGVSAKFAEFKDDILLYELPTPDKLQEDGQDEAEKIWTKFEDSFTASLRCSDVRTIVVDTATELWEILRLARFGSLSKIKGFSKEAAKFAYTPVNREFRGFLRQIAKHPEKSLILNHQMKPEYIDDKRTGRYERAGFGNIEFIAQAVIELDRRDPSEDDPNHTFLLKVLDSRHNPSVNGLVLENEMCSFPMLASMVIEGTSPDMYM
jgi:hypothetical protein